MGREFYVLLPHTKTRKQMPQVGNEQNPVIFKNKKKGNRKLVRAGSKSTPAERQRYKDNWEVIFGKKNK